MRAGHETARWPPEPRAGEHVPLSLGVELKRKPEALGAVAGDTVHPAGSDVVVPTTEAGTGRPVEWFAITGHYGFEH